MTENTNACLVTAKQAAAALAIYDTDDQKGETIAQDMLDGVVNFTPDEIKELAKLKGISLYELAIANRNRNISKIVIFEMLEGLTTEQLQEILKRLAMISKA